MTSRTTASASIDPSILANMTKKECESFFSSGTQENGKVLYNNPLNPTSRRRITEDGPTYQKIKKHCDGLNTQSVAVTTSRGRPKKTLATIASANAANADDTLAAFSNLSIRKSPVNSVSAAHVNDNAKIEKWLQNPLYDPVNKKKIKVNFAVDSEYRKLYNMATNYLKTKGVSNVQEQLPKTHYLFEGTIDLLYENDSELYAFMLDSLEKTSNKTFRQLGYSPYSDLSNFSEFEKKIFCVFVDLLAYLIAKYYYYLNLIFMVPYEQYYKLVDEIKEDIQKINLIVYFNSIYQLKYEFKNNHLGPQLISDHMKEFKKLHISTYPKKDAKLEYKFSLLQDQLLLHQDISVAVSSYYEELYNIFNYKNDPDKSPFRNLENEQFHTIEDPLIKIINKYLGNDTFKHLNFETLELPVRTFKNDEEYKTLKREYDNLTKQYEKTKAEWNAEYERIKSLRNKSPTLSELPIPERPFVMLPIPNSTEKRKFFVGQLFPKHISDAEYAKLEAEYKKDEAVIKLYKELINVGLLDLIQNPPDLNNSSSSSHSSSKSSQNSESSSQTSKKSSKTSVYELMKKNRDYFHENVLDDGYSEDKDKCAVNNDILIPEKFDDDNYLLSKLQLMYRLKSQNTTYCFYAPNMYNYIVSNVINGLPVVHPATKEPISQKDIEKLMKIMNVIDPSLKAPKFIKPIHDTMLRMDHPMPEPVYKDHPYFNIFISRKFGDIDIKIYDLCSILADVTTKEMKSNDIDSNIFLRNIYTLFYEGKLLKTYMPPYFIENTDVNNLSNEYIALSIPFTAFDKPAKWDKPRNEQLKMFVEHLNNVKDYL